MKLKGREFSTPNRDYVVFKRFGGEDVVFTIQAVTNFDEFEKAYPAPTPPTVLHSDGSKLQDYKDEDYLKRAHEYLVHRANWIYLESMSATEGLEWDTVEAADPKTWGNFKDEMKAAFFTESEIVYLITKIHEINSLSEDKLEEARESFLAMMSPDEK